MIESLRPRLGRPNVLPILREWGGQTRALLSLALPGAGVTIELPTERGSAHPGSILPRRSPGGIRTRR